MQKMILAGSPTQARSHGCCCFPPKRLDFHLCVSYRSFNLAHRRATGPSLVCLRAIWDFGSAAEMPSDFCL